MKLKHKMIGDVAVIEIHGKLIGGPGESSDFHSFIRSLIDAGHTRLVVNLHRTSWANSQGIGLLIGAYTSARNKGGDLVLTHVLDRIAGILSVTRLYLIFRVFDSDDEAVANLAAADAPKQGSKGGEDTPGPGSMRNQL